MPRSWLLVWEQHINFKDPPSKAGRKVHGAGRTLVIYETGLKRNLGMAEP